jgi:two-component system cell cycle response regulator DivK
MKSPVLLIEDNEQNRYLATYLLEVRGWQVIQAADGPSGISLAHTAKPAILLDIQLPGMDGYEVARRLRASPATAPIPIVAVTSYAMAADRAAALAAGCDNYIEKPIDPATFVDRIEDQLRRHLDGTLA